MKILIGVVTNEVKDYCWDKFKAQLKELNKEHDVLIVDNSDRVVNRPPFKTINYRGAKEMRIHFMQKNFELKRKDNYLTVVTKDCMNILREEFLKGDYTHLWVLESDVFVDKDGLQRLIDMKADVANLTYLMRLQRNNGELSLCVQSTDTKGKSRMISPQDSKDLVNNGVKVLGVDTLNGKTLTHCGYGCTLIARRVLEQVEFKAVVTPDGLNPFPDSMFHTDVNKLKFTNKLDTDYIPYHWNIQGETEQMMKIVQIRNSSSRRERRKAKNKKHKW